MISITRLILVLYPRKLRENFDELLKYCEVKKDLDGFLFLVTLISIIISFFIALFVKIFGDFSFIITFLVSFFFVEASIYAWLVLNADSKAAFVEDLLPDVLQLMASNLRAGLTVDRALLLSARPEFGKFQDEINRVGKEIATGKEIDEALLELSSRIRSEKIKKTFQLIISGMESGGELANLLEQTASNLRQQKLVDQRVRTSVLVYVIFIFSAIGFGAPMLFGLSSFLVEVITDIFGKIQLPPASATGSLPITFTQVDITPKFVNTYAIVSLVVTAILGSLILGLISRGKEKEGLKFIPILLGLTIGLFFLVKFIIRTLLGGLFNI